MHTYLGLIWKYHKHPKELFQGHNNKAIILV